MTDSTDKPDRPKRTRKTSASAEDTPQDADVLESSEESEKDTLAGGAAAKDAAVSPASVEVVSGREGAPDATKTKEVETKKPTEVKSSPPITLAERMRFSRPLRKK